MQLYGMIAAVGCGFVCHDKIVEDRIQLTFLFTLFFSSVPLLFVLIEMPCDNV